MQMVIDNVVNIIDTDDGILLTTVCGKSITLDNKFEFITIRPISDACIVTACAPNVDTF